MMPNSALHAPRHFLVFLFLSVSLAGGGMVEPSKAWPKTKDGKSVLNVQEGELETRMSQPYRYEAGGRRDPFVPLQTGDSLEKTDVALSSISEEKDGTLSLMGIISGKGGYQALIQLPTGQRLIVGPGTRLESVPGAVKRITRDRVIIAKSKEANGEAGVVELSVFMAP